jgi:hypothetical protein
MGTLCSTEKSRNAEFFAPKRENNIINFSSSFQRIELKFAMRQVDLAKYCIEIYEKSGNSTIFLGRTEELHGSNIDFLNLIDYNYSFEKNQLILIKVWKNDLVGSLNTIPFAQIMANKGLMTSLQILQGTLLIEAKRSKEDSLEADLQISLLVKSKKKVLKPFFYLKRDVSPEKNFPNYISSYKSEVLRDSKHYVFQKVLMCVSHLTENMDTKPFRIEFFNENMNIPLGYQHINIENYIQGISETKVLPLIDYKTKQISSNYDVELTLLLRKIYRFTDYLQGGMKIALIIGIDFTSSNMQIEDPVSLHYWDNDHFNSYESVINTCGHMVAYYDYDQLFPVFGFGAKLPGNDNVNYCFPINFNDNPDIYTVENILKEYRKCLTKITFAEPTNFAPIIQKAIDMCNQSNDPYTYNILMILTDGQIDDILDTIELLVKASDMPLSLIIIGIGGADFSRMGFLDADIAPLVNKLGVQAKRDFIQFVEYRKFQNDSHKLASEVLRELPSQVEEYYKMKNIQPNIPIHETL